jgi:hypothetical protein
MFWSALLAGLLAPDSSGWAGPPYFTDDPGLPDSGKFEIYAFNAGIAGQEGHSGVVGIDFNYGVTNDLQATAVAPIGYDSSADARSTMGLGNIELAAKYRFLHQAEFGWDVSVTPRIFLSSSSPVDVRHTSFLLPIWLGKSWDKWSTFGGGVRNQSRARITGLLLDGMGANPAGSTKSADGHRNLSSNCGGLCGTQHNSRWCRPAVRCERSLPFARFD